MRSSLQTLSPPTRRHVSALAVGIVLSLLAAACGKAPAPKASSSADGGIRYVASTLDGVDISLPATGDRLTLVNVWATWCEPCLDELPLLADIHTELRGPRFSVLAISVDSARNHQRVKDTVRDWELPFPVVHDPDNRIVPTLKVSGYPTSVLIDGHGLEVARREGVLQGATGPFLSQVRAALRERG
jgi:thiol-disulfide isomerase/thioredoxin